MPDFVIKLWQSQFLRFLLVGGTAASTAFLARYLLDQVMDFKTAVALSYFVGMLVSFYLNKYFVFDSAIAISGKQVSSFVQVNAVGFVLVWLVSVGLGRMLFPAIGFTWYADHIAHLIGLASPMASSFFLYRHFTFRQPTE